MEEIQGVARKAKIVVKRTETYLSMDDGPGGNPPRSITRERVLFRGSFKAFAIWRKVHRVTERDRAVFVRAGDSQ